MNRCSWVVFVLGALLSLSMLAWAQSDTARIVGTVTDSSGAVVSNAAILVTNTATGSRLEAASQADGSFVATPLRVGTYSIEVSAPSFRKSVHTGIVLNVNDVARFEIKLQPGQTSEVVEVSGGTPVVSADTSSVGDVISEQAIINLPLNGRNFTQLATLVPGVTRGTPGSNADGSGGNAETFRQGENGSAALSVNGLREQNNNFQLDGIDNNESIVNTIVFFPPVEALQEFRVITANASAEFGRGGGAIVNAVMKSGGNAFHGSGFEFHRNSVLDATPTFSKIGKPTFIRNQFGGTIGGPIIKNRTFFFADYQGLRQRLPIDVGSKVTVPTLKMRNGDFSELLNSAFTGVGDSITIYDPATGTPFAGNIITTPLNPVGQAYLNLFPLPDLTDRAQGNLFVRRLRRQTFNDGDVRLDHKISEKDSVFARFSIAEDRQSDNGKIPGFHAGFGSGTNRVIAHSAVGNYTRIFSPTFINEARFGWVRQKIDFEPVNFGIDQNALVGIGGLQGISPAEKGGIALIGGGDGRFLEYLGDGGPFRLKERTLQFSDSATWTLQRHTLKFGGAIIQRHIDSLQSDLGKGFYFFDDFTATTGRTPAAGRTGYELAEMLIGRTSFTTAAFVTPTTAISWEHGYFLQDDWRVNSRLTLNLGMRYELFTPPHEESDRLANFDPVTQKLVLPGNGVPRSTVDTDNNNWGPRVGVAYDLTGDGKTVLRGSYGLFYALDRGGIANQLTQNPPFNTLQFNFNFGDVTPAGIAAGGQLQLQDVIPAPAVVDPAQSVLPTGSKVRFIPRNTDNTRVQQYNVTIARAITSTLGFDISYVGTHGDDVTAVTTQSGFGGSITGLITTIANVGKSNYNSLQMKLNQRPTLDGPFKGLSYLASYTWGKATNNSPGAFPGTGGAFRQTPADKDGLAEGLADYDVAHRFTFAGTYEFPFFKNLQSPFAKKVLDGWGANSIITIQSGNVFSVFGGAGRAKLIGDPNPTSPNVYFNPAAFDNSATLDEQSGRNFLRGPGFANVDLSIFRQIKLSEFAKMEFRSEFFNLFNRPQLGLPNIFCCGGDFGTITTIRPNSERQIQFGARITF